MKNSGGTIPRRLSSTRDVRRVSTQLGPPLSRKLHWRNTDVVRSIQLVKVSITVILDNGIPNRLSLKAAK